MVFQIHDLSLEVTVGVESVTGLSSEIRPCALSQLCVQVAVRLKNNRARRKHLFTINLFQILAGETKVASPYA